MNCIDGIPNLNMPPPYHPNCLCTLIEDHFEDPDDDGGERVDDRKYLIIVYRRKLALSQ